MAHFIYHMFRGNSLCFTDITLFIHIVTRVGGLNFFSCYFVVQRNLFNLLSLPQFPPVAAHGKRGIMLTGVYYAPILILSSLQDSTTSCTFHPTPYKLIYSPLPLPGIHRSSRMERSLVHKQTAAARIVTDSKKSYLSTNGLAYLGAT